MFGKTLSARAQARIAGAVYLLVMVLGFFAEGYVRGKLVVSGDPAATAHDILHSEQLWRIGGAAEFVTLICDVTLALLLYNLLSAVSGTLALLAAFFRLVFCAVYATLSIAHFAPLILLKGDGYLSAFTPGQLQALAYFILRLHGTGYDIALVFFGIHIVLIGLLILLSTFLPRLIGWMLMVAGVCYTVGSLLSFAAPLIADPLYPWILLPGLAAEGSLALWLLIVGVNLDKWNARAARTYAGSQRSGLDL